MPPKRPSHLQRPLNASPCQSLCSWQSTGERLVNLPLFRCTGCGSEWVRSEAWTPADYTGRVPPTVAAEASRR